MTTDQTRTTIRIDRVLYRRLKEHAAHTGQTVGQVIGDAVRDVLEPADPVPGPLPDLPVFGGSGTRPGVDLADRSALHDLMDEELGDQDLGDAALPGSGVGGADRVADAMR